MKSSYIIKNSKNFEAANRNSQSRTYSIFVSINAGGLGTPHNHHQPFTPVFISFGSFTLFDPTVGFHSMFPQLIIVPGNTIRVGRAH